MKRIRIVFPTEWDDRQLPACRDAWRERFEIDFAEPSDEDCPWDLDPMAYIESEVERARDGVAGVLSSSDYPGATVAGAIAARLGLPGTPPANVIRCSHKFYARQAQLEDVPEATPRFYLVDPSLPDGGAPDLVFPCFIKPVKGAFSVMSGRIDSRAELREFLGRPAVAEFLESYVLVFNRLVRGLTDFEIDGSYFLAEELLKGKQVTVEGYVHPDGVDLLGIVDSVRHPRTKSFVRFDYPSSLPHRLQDRVWDVARRTVEGLGLRSTLFNVEMMVNAATERVSIVEVNPRMCGQFADLYEKVDGVNGYEVALALAASERPPRARREGPYRAASSVPLRIFETSRVVSAPSRETLEQAESLFEKTLVWTECATGDALDDFESLEDGRSARYGIVNLGAADREGVQQRLEEIQRVLDFRFEPLPPRGGLSK